MNTSTTENFTRFKDPKMPKMDHFSLSLKIKKEATPSFWTNAAGCVAPRVLLTPRGPLAPRGARIHIFLTRKNCLRSDDHLREQFRTKNFKPI